MLYEARTSGQQIVVFAENRWLGLHAVAEEQAVDAAKLCLGDGSRRSAHVANHAIITLLLDDDTIPDEIATSGNGSLALSLSRGRASLVEA